MITLFSAILDMNFAGGITILMVLLLRAVLHKAPKAFAVTAWAIAAVRLLCPFSLTSVFSLMPTVIPPTASDGTLTLTVLEESVTLPMSTSIGQSYEAVAAALWCIGVAVMVIYTVMAYRRTHKTLREAVRLEGNVYECDRIPTPFIFGVFPARIYLPSSMAEQDRRFVIAHETAHIARWDHVWKPLGFAVLALHWFNPLVWLAYVLFCRDMEMACDERVLATLGSHTKKLYADALINCAAPTRRIAACPLSFGETDVKARVRTVLRYRKPSFWLSTTAALACLLLMMCFLTDPKVAASEMPTEPPTVSATSPVTTDTQPTFTTPTLVQYTQSMSIEFLSAHMVTAGESVTVRVSVQDSRGVQSDVEVLLMCEDEDGMLMSIGESAVLTRVQGDATNGVYEGELTVPPAAVGGAYRLRASYLPVSEKPALCTAYTPEGEAALTVI